MSITNKYLKVGIHRAVHDKVDSELEVYRKILQHNGVSYIDLDSSDTDFWKNVNDITHFIYKWTDTHLDHQIANAIIPVIQHQKKINCFPNWETSWHYDDKIKQTFLLKENGFPICESYVFYHKRQALEWIESAKYPLVIKLKNGAGSLSVFLIKSKRRARKFVNKMFGKGIMQTNLSFIHIARTLNFDPVTIFRYYTINFRNKHIIPEKQKLWLRHKNYIYFQKYLPDNKYDTRVTTAGNRAHAFRRFNRKNDFRASGSNVWDINPNKIDIRMVKIALDISKYFGFQAMAYDFLYDEEKEPQIVEISYLYGGAGYPDFMNGYWDENLNWREGRYWPQHFELMDFLEMPDLKLPNIETNTGYKKAKFI
jgi:glutathione synthase/RimK-type ligase-like ATP-grasp enzyme